MSVKSIFSAALLLGIPAGPALAEDARLAYRQLYNIQKAEAEWNRTHTNLVVVMLMQSTLPTVKTSDLSAAIDSRSGKMPLVIGPAGDFVVPMRDELLAENPWILVNQPKGTMKLSWQMGVVSGPITNTVHYARLMQPVRDSEDVQEQMRQILPNSPKMIMTGLKLTFSAEQKKAKATIHARDGDRKLKADEHGEIIVPLITDLLDEDPAISLSDVPIALTIVSRPSAR